MGVQSHVKEKDKVCLCMCVCVCVCVIAGASAVVFKCLWPQRFGPNAYLAIKVLKDPYEADPTVFESFCYEAAVLASVRHPNVVRMYAVGGLRGAVLFGCMRWVA